MASRRDKRAQRVRLHEQTLPSFAWRRRIVLGIFVIAASGLIWRAVDQQILHKDFLQSEGADRYLAKVDMPAHRGLITDRRGDVLALSTPVDSVAANPRLLTRDPARISLLAEALQMDEEQLRSRIAKAAGRHFVYLKRALPPDDAKRIIELANAQGINGIHLEREYRRYYPAGEVFAHVLGFTNIDDSGQEGLELAFDAVLRGVDGAKLVLRDGRRKVVDDVESIATPRAGNHLALSLDQRLQFIAYRELKAAVTRHRALAGSLVMLDARSGEVLAMANQPWFNPNASRSNQSGALRNRAVTDVFEPGSTMKPLVVAAALDRGVISADSVIDTGPGFFYVGKAQVKDKRNLGSIDLTTLLSRSSNVGAGRIALLLKARELWETMGRLGFGTQPLSGFPGEASGHLNDHRRWAQIDQATLSFGYGLSVSALQLAQAYQALANDGVRVPVTLLKRDAVPEGERAFAARSAVEVRRMLESATTAEGTAVEAAVPGYSIAGKTGTVRKFGPNGYSDDRYLSLFAGMAPARDPRVVMVVMLDEPRAGKFYGGQVAGPVFSTVMAETLRLLNVAPDLVVDHSMRLANAAGQY